MIRVVKDETLNSIDGLDKQEFNDAFKLLEDNSENLVQIALICFGNFPKINQ